LSRLGRHLSQRYGFGADSVALVWRGQVLTRSAAVLAITRHLSGDQLLSLIGRLVPAVLRDALYRLLASRRHGWFLHQEPGKSVCSGRLVKRRNYRG
jgi:predicted DCC family thiol-disulfide oxidoreductase YuxK